MFLFEEKQLQPVTIRGYRSAIARVYRLCGFDDCGQDFHLSALMANFDIQRPRRRTLFPRWDLGIVLDYLQSDTFSSTDDIPLLFLTLKTVFLVALASALRVSELHALAVADEYCRFNVDGSCSLTTCAGFVAKNKTPSSAPQQITLAPLLENPQLCPVSFLRCYVRRTESIRGTNHQLFVSARSPSAKTTPQLISAYLRSIVRRAYEWRASVPDAAPLDSSASPPLQQAPSSTPVALEDRRMLLRLGEDCRPAEVHRSSEGTEEPDPAVPVLAEASRSDRGQRGPFPVHSLRPGSELRWDAAQVLAPSSPLARCGRRVSPGVSGTGPVSPPQLTGRTAHELRALASSLALFRGTPVADIVRAVGWSAPSTFQRFYLRDLSADLHRLPAARHPQ